MPTLMALQVNAIKTDTSAPAMGYINRYNATAGTLAVTLPALSGLNVSSYAMVQKDALDVSAHAVTFTRAGTDLFDDSTTSFALGESGEARTIQVVSIGGVKRWKIIGSMGGAAGSTITAADITDASTIGRTVLTAANSAAIRSAIGVTSTVFSTADYAAVSGDDRPRVVSAVAAAVSAITATGQDQVVYIHAPLTFTTGVTKAALGTTIDTQNIAYGNVGVPLPTNLAHTLHIVFAPGAKITLSSNCRNMFYIDKLADYDVFRNVNFYNAWVDGAGLSLALPGHNAHALVGNMPNYGTSQRYLSYQNINFFGYTRFTNFYWDAGGASQGQTGIVFTGDHNGPLEATQTFTKNIYLENGDQQGGAGLIWVCSEVGNNIRPGGVNHYYDNIVVDRYRCVMPTTPTSYTNHVHTGVYITGSGFGDRAYIGPGYVENIGDDAIELGTMQQVDIISPQSKNPWYQGILIRQTHAPINIEGQRINIRGLQCEVTTALSATTGATGIPLHLYIDDQVVTLTGTATGGTGTISVPGYGATSSLGATATAAQIQTAVRAIHTDLNTSIATGGPLGTAAVTLKVARLNSVSPITVSTGSLTGGTWNVDLSPSNASFGTVTVEDMVYRADGLARSRQGIDHGMFILGLEYPHRKINIIRPKITLNNYVFDSAFTTDISLMHLASPFKDWGYVSLNDYELVFSGSSTDMSAGAGDANFHEILVDGYYTRADIDGMISDRAVAINAGDLCMVGAGKSSSSSFNIRVTARRLTPKNVASGSFNRGAVLFGNGQVDRFDITDSDFASLADASRGFALGSAGSNAANARAARNIYSVAPPGATITPSGSPFAWRNVLGMTAIVEVSGGTVSQIARGDRTGTYTTSAFTSGSFTVEAGAYLKVTYSVAPTMSYTLLS